jgi:hypothetical protein
MYFLHTVQKVISRWGSRVLHRFIDFKTQTKLLFSFFFLICRYGFLVESFTCFKQFTLYYFKAIFPSIISPIMMIA